MSALTTRDVPLEIDPEEFRRLGHALIDSVAEFLPSRRTRPVTPFEAPSEVQRLIGADRSLPLEGTDPGELLHDTARLLYDHSLFNGHPRFLGYITASPAPIGMLGDLLAAAVNPNVGSWRLAPVATEIEAQVVRWIAELIGYPTDGGGLLVSGGNMANMVPFFAARRAAADWDIRALGLAHPSARPMRVYASAETHTWLQKAADLSGIGTDAIRWIPTDSELRMDMAALRDAVRTDREAGDLPMMVIGTAGSVSTGAIDPLHDIAAFCRKERIWFHVDGAYGALAAAVPDAPEELRAMALADSVAVDPHKWLYAPLEAGCVLVRDPLHLRDAFSYHPPYYHFGQEAVNFVDFGMQNSRGFRALKVWLQLQHAGRSGYQRMIADDIALAAELYRQVEAHDELQAETLSLSIATFRYVPPSLRGAVGTPDGEARLNALNQALLERVQGSGEVFVSNAVINGRYLLRACVVNLNTRAEDVAAIPEIVARLGREVRRE
ncbi:MAG TPA: aminotransferase class V-fold PLP-dependent enzyme, partial [Gemmatimonadales bacterium]|nr:aminotransferase class V-fold PLP-dependent enzyme [Gemmatimonadales bacterium]